MSSVYSIRMPSKLKKELDSLGQAVNWQEEIRAFLEERVRKERIKKQLEAARKNKERMKTALDVADLMRQDREGVH